MNAELFAKRLEMCRLLNRFLEKFVEFWTTMAAQKFMILLEKEKRTVRESAPVTLSDTKKASMFREKNKSLCWMGKAPYKFVNFVRVFCICVYY